MVVKVQDTENLHFMVLRQLQAKPEMSQRELAQAVGVSLGKTNYCLKALLDQDLVRKHKFQGKRRKLSYAYLLTPNGTAEKAALTSRYLQRKMDEYATLKAEIESLQQEQKAAISQVSPTRRVPSQRGRSSNKAAGPVGIDWSGGPTANSPNATLQDSEMRDFLSCIGE